MDEDAVGGVVLNGGAGGLIAVLYTSEKGPQNAKNALFFPLNDDCIGHQLSARRGVTHTGPLIPDVSRKLEFIPLRQVSYLFQW